MGYVLRNGKRYYQYEDGRLERDILTQEEADRRERRNINRTPFRPAGIPSGSSINRSGGRTTASSVPWGLILVVCILCMIAGAFYYNSTHDSPAEQAITDYMNGTAWANGDQKDNEEAVPEHSDSVSASGTCYLLPDSASRYLEAGEICGYSHDEIQMMINEIYARHGREFQSQNNRAYFEGMDWYQPVPGKTDDEIVREFNEYERANVDLLSEYL